MSKQKNDIIGLRLLDLYEKSGGKCPLPDFAEAITGVTLSPLQRRLLDHLEAVETEKKVEVK